MNFVVSCILQTGGTQLLHQGIRSGRNEAEAIGKYLLEVKETDANPVCVPLAVSLFELENYKE